MPRLVEEAVAHIPEAQAELVLPMPEPELLLAEPAPFVPRVEPPIVLPPYHDEPVRGPSLFERMAGAVARRKVDHTATLIAAE